MPRRRARKRAGTTRAMVRTTRVHLREAEFVAAHGPCEQCGKTKDLEAFWRDRDDRPLGYIQAYWLAGEQTRADLLDKVIVLCAEDMRIHKGGVPHGGGVSGVKGCHCIPCKDRRREYVRNKHREHRSRGKGDS